MSKKSLSLWGLFPTFETPQSKPVWQQILKPDPLFTEEHLKEFISQSEKDNPEIIKHEIRKSEIA